MTLRLSLGCTDLEDIHSVICHKLLRRLEGLLDDRPLPSPLPELASLASRSARAFCSLGTCTNSNATNAPFSTWTHFKYAAICGSFAWYSPVTCPVTSSESLFAKRLCAPISLARSIPAIRASYSAWLLLALKANRRACSINTPLGPSKTILTPVPCCFEDPSTDNSHWESSSTSRGAPPGDSSVTKSTWICPLMDPLGLYTVSNSDSSTA